MSYFKVAQWQRKYCLIDGKLHKEIDKKSNIRNKNWYRISNAYISVMDVHRDPVNCLCNHLYSYRQWISLEPGISVRPSVNPLQKDGWLLAYLPSEIMIGEPGYIRAVKILGFPPKGLDIHRPSHFYTGYRLRNVSLLGLPQCCESFRFNIKFRETNIHESKTGNTMQPVLFVWVFSMAVYTCEAIITNILD